MTFDPHAAGERFDLHAADLVSHSHPDSDDSAIAPCRHVPGALPMADWAAHGLRTLQAGEGREVWMSIDRAVL